MSVSLEQPNWLAYLIHEILSNYDIESAYERASALPEEKKGLAAMEASLKFRNLDKGLPTLFPDLAEDPNHFPTYKFLSTLKHQGEVALDVAIALNRPAQGEFARMALLMVWWASLNQKDQVDTLTDIWKEVASGQRQIEELTPYFDQHVESLGAHLKSQALLKDDPLLALPINQGVSYFDVRMAGLLAEALHDDEHLEPHEIEQIMTIMNKDRLRFLEATIALAWSNGLLEAEERKLIKKQIEMLRLDRKTARKMLNLMITPSTPKEFIHNFSSREVTLFVLRQLVIASMVDGVQDAKERKFLQRTAKEMDIPDPDFRKLLEEMNAFLDDNRASIDAMKKQKTVRRVARL
ncbi:MAG: DUF533 domain-containing protein [Myxococcota bacterium]